MQPKAAHVAATPPDDNWRREHSAVEANRRKRFVDIQEACAPVLPQPPAGAARESGRITPRSTAARGSSSNPKPVREGASVAVTKT